MSTQIDFFLGRLGHPPRQRYAVQPRPGAMPLQMRVIAAGRWPWPSDGDVTRLLPPRDWRRFGSTLSPFDARGEGIWSPHNFVRLQLGRCGNRT